MEMISIDKFPSNTSILLNEDFLKELKTKTLPRDRIFLKQCSGTFFNLGKILKLSEKYRIWTGEIEKNILAYRTTKGRITILKPILPVKVTPLFDMILIHAIADGHCTKINNRIPGFVYTQTKNDILDLFIKKVENTFGRLEYDTKYFYTTKRLYLPSSISYAIYKHYGLKPEDFLENNSRIPQEMLQKDKEYLVAILIAFILDEGHIDSSNIVIGLHNKPLIGDIKSICDKLGYRNVLKSHGIKNHLYILSDGVKKFWEDYKVLKDKYPEVSLSYKEGQIEDFILRTNKLWKSASQGEIQNKIIESLKESDKTVKDLSIIFQISRQGIKYHIRYLENLGVVKRIGKGYANSDIYRLKKYIKVPVKIKGRARQYGITNDIIIDMIKLEPMTTKEISDKIKIDRATILHFLLNLEKNGKIKRLGSKIHKTHPSILWSVK